MIIKGFELLQIPENMIMSNEVQIDNGYYTLGDDRVNIISRPIGFDIKINKNLQKIIVQTGSIRKTDDGERFYLDDYFSGETILGTYIGLLPSTYKIEDIDQNLIFYGISFSKLMEFYMFSPISRYPGLSTDEKLYLLDDLIVDEPIISTVTVNRLHLDENYQIRKITPGDFLRDETVFENKNNEETDITEDLMDVFTNVDLESETFLKKIFNEDLESSPQIEWFDPDIDLNLISNLQTLTLKFMSTRILTRIRGLKYRLISDMVVPEGNVCKKSINKINQIYNNQYINHSILYMYDRIFSNKDDPSPRLVKINLNEDFETKFNL
jgi:hypothetical protein